MFERMRSWWARCIHAGFNPGWAARNVQTPVTRLEDLDAFFTEWESLINDPLNISHAVEGLFSPRKTFERLRKQQRGMSETEYRRIYQNEWLPSPAEVERLAGRDEL